MVKCDPSGLAILQYHFKIPTHSQDRLDMVELEWLHARSCKCVSRRHYVCNLTAVQRLGSNAVEYFGKASIYLLLRWIFSGRPRAALREAFSPDYNLPLVNIYTKATRAAICSSDPTLLLKAQCLVRRPGCPHPDTDFPSWVPIYHFVHDKARGSYNPLSKSDEIPTDAKAQEMRVDTNVPPGILRIVGVVLDTVSEVCEQLPSSYPNRGHVAPGPCYRVQCAKPRCVEYSEPVLRIMSQLWHTALAANPHVPSTELATIFRTTLLMRADRDETHLRGFGLDINYRSTFRDFVAQFWPVVSNAPAESEVFVQEEPAAVDDSDLDNEYSDDDDSEQPGQLPVGSSVASLEEHEDLTLDKFWGRILSEHVNRKFCVTSSGRMGSAAPRVQTGDRIYMLSGMTVPVVLRPVDGDWVLIGDAYLSGPASVRTSRCEQLDDHLAKYGQDEHTNMQETEERWFNFSFYRFITSTNNPGVVGEGRVVAAAQLEGLAVDAAAAGLGVGRAQQQAAAEALAPVGALGRLLSGLHRDGYRGGGREGEEAGEDGEELHGCC
ncbi:HET-domain-containing protein [Apiospora rasikravindrae]|uniref:HET-domain-containing protein n=1 Tax=Apiospora rasikravindrae TaxID=990691 RepID=A0ABR1UAG9_9PEZI